MARPKDADSARTIDEVLAAAHAILEEQATPTAPSLRAVAKRAGVSLGTIQYYFQTKDNLVEACLDAFHGRFAEVVQGLLSEARSRQDSQALVEHSIRTLYRTVSEQRVLLALRVATTSRRGELPPERQQELTRALLREAAKAMARHVEISEAELRLAIQAISALVVRFALSSEGELEILTDLRGAPAQQAAEDYVVLAGRRLVRPTDDPSP